MRRRRWLFPPAAILAVSLVTAAASLGSAGDTVLVSGPNGVAVDGFPIGGHVPTISGDGRYVAYVEDTPDSGTAIYLRDMNGGITPVDVPGGIGPQGLGFAAGGPSLSSSGRFLVFASEDPALSSEDEDFVVTPAGDSFPVRDVFAYDRVTGAMSLVSRAGGPGGAAGNENSNFPEVSANGRYVAFATEATNFIRGVFASVYVRDLHTQKTILVGRGNGPRGKALEAFNPSISGNGAMVAFLEVLKHTHGRLWVAVRDVKRNRTVLVSRASGSHGAIASDSCSDPEISANGRYVAFVSKAENLSRVDENGVEDVFVSDLKTNRTILVTRAAGKHGDPGQGDSSNPSISANGRYVAFESYANNLGPPDNGSLVDVFVKDLRTGRVFLASRASGNGSAANAPSDNPAISGDGRFVAFESRSSNLSPADPDRTESVFRYQLSP